MRVELSLTTKNIEPLRADLEIIGVKFSSDQKFLKEELLSDDFKKGIGLFGVESYKKSPYFFRRAEYATTEIGFSEKVKQIIDINIEFYLTTFNRLMSFLWLQKDNCCSIDSIYVFLPEHKTIFQRSAGYNYSNCKGVVNEKASFTNEQIETAFLLYAGISDKFYHRNIKIGRSEVPQPDLIVDRTLARYDIKKETRLERALNFLDLARKASSLPQKIGFFICIYETLFFGKDSGEISHQIAERVALYASKVRVFRQGIYKLIKEAYAIRSTYFHGNSFEKVKDSKLADIAESIDELTRNVLNDIITRDADIFLQSKEALELSFMDLLFEDQRRPSGLTIETGLRHLRFNQ